MLQQTEFFTELLKKFSKEKDAEGRRQEYTARRQSRIRDIRRYYTDKLRLWIQAYPGNIFTNFMRQWQSCRVNISGLQMLAISLLEIKCLQSMLQQKECYQSSRIK